MYLSVLYFRAVIWAHKHYPESTSTMGHHPFNHCPLRCRFCSLSITLFSLVSIQSLFQKHTVVVNSSSKLWLFYLLNCFKWINVRFCFSPLFPRVWPGASGWGFGTNIHEILEGVPPQWDQTVPATSNNWNPREALWHRGQTLQEIKKNKKIFFIHLYLNLGDFKVHIYRAF